MKIIIPAKEYQVPDGKKCYSWSQDDGGWQKIKCQFYYNNQSYISAKEAQASGLGFSGGTIDNHTCSLFRQGLKSEIGVGVFKCDECKAATREEKI